MIKAEELMIGNLLIYSDNSSIFEVSGIHEFGIDCFDDIEETYIEYENFEPILITEKWLINLGFEKKTYSYLTLYYYSLDVLSHGQISFHKTESGFKIDLGTITGYQFGTTHVKYVHQMQNLYFALTNQKLILKKIKL